MKFVFRFSPNSLIVPDIYGIKCLLICLKMAEIKGEDIKIYESANKNGEEVVFKRMDGKLVQTFFPYETTMTAKVDYWQCFKEGGIEYK